MIDEVLLLLIKKAAHREPIRMTTEQIAEELGIRSRAASRKMIALEKEGKVKRIGRDIVVTLSGEEEAKSMLAELSGALSEKREITVAGTVVFRSR